MKHTGLLIIALLLAGTTIYLLDWAMKSKHELEKISQERELENVLMYTSGFEEGAAMAVNKEWAEKKSKEIMGVVNEELYPGNEEMVREEIKRLLLRK